MIYRFTHVRGQFAGACATHVDTGKMLPDVPQTSRELFSTFQDALSSILTTRDLEEQYPESYGQYAVRANFVDAFCDGYSRRIVRFRVFRS